MATYTDTFTEGSNTVLTSHTPDSGGTWTGLLDTTAGASVPTVFSATGVLSPSANSNSNRVASTVSWTPATADYDVTMVADGVSAGDDAFWIIARCTDASNFYAAVFYGGATTCYIIEVVAGVVADLTSGAATIANGDSLKFELIGTALKVYQNAVQILSVTDASLASAGKVGIGFGNIRTALDDVNTSVDITSFVLTDIVGGSSVVPIVLSQYRRRRGI